MNYAVVVGTIRLYWKTFTAVAAALMALGLVWIFVARDLYVSTAQVLVSMQGSTTAEAYQNDEVIRARINSYIALLSTDVVSQRVIDQLGLNTSAQELAARISAANIPPNTSLIDIAVADESPEQSRRLTQTVADEFVSYANALETPTGEGSQKVQSAVVTAAREPHQRRLEMVLLSCLVLFAALIFAGMAVWLQSLADPVVRAPNRASAAAGVPVLGTVRSASIRSAEDLDSYRRLLLTRPSMADDAGRVLAITSLEGHVDAYRVAHSLGMVTVLSGRRAVVLNAYRQERVAESTRANASGHRHADAPGRRRWGNPVRGMDGLPDTLDVSKWVADPERNGTASVSELIVRLQQDYDSVIVACSPVLSPSMACTFERLADDVLLVVLMEISKRRDVVDAEDCFRKSGATLTGVLLVRTGTEETLANNTPVRQQGSSRRVTRTEVANKYREPTGLESVVRSRRER